MECPRCHRENNEDSRFCASCGTSLPGEPPAGGTLTFFTDPDAFATGALFAGRYRIIEEIGHGGMGQVYKAYDTKVQEKIALKIIRPEVARNRSAVERFRNELKLARQITHPNVCRVFDLGEDAGTDFLTMEFVPGENLALMIRMTGPLALETAVGYARQMAKGLAAAHRLGVIHRDLKPHNILIDESGTAKIMDFGIARSLIAGTAADDGKMIGTPDYMAPEQAAGRPVDGRTDIYALGVILYEMVTGRRPFKGDTPHDIVLKHRIDSPKPPVELDGRIPAELSAMILKCLAKDPADRYQTADELLAALEELGPVISPAPEGTPGRRQRFRPMAIFRKAAPWALLLLLGAALFVRWPSANRAPEDPPLGPEAENRLAILKLSDSSAGSRKEIYGEGLSDGIRARFGAAYVIKLISKPSCDKVDLMKDGLRKVGKKLQARHIVYGSYAIEGDMLRVSVYLGDAATDTEIVIGRYVDQFINLFDVEDKIASAVAGRLQVTLSAARLKGVRKRDPVNVEAKTSYLEGQKAQKEYRQSNRNEDYARAEGFYVQATRLDPRYALAFVGLGNLAEARFVRAKIPVESQAALALMKSRFQEAADLDADLAEADIGLGLAYLYEDNREQAARRTLKALRSDPENSDVIYGAGAFLRSVGLYDRALVHFLKAAEIDAELDRLNPTAIFNAAGCYWYLGQYDKAEAALRGIADLDSGNYRFHLNLARQLLMQARLDEAAAEIAAAEKLTPAGVLSAQDSLRRHQAWLAAARGERDRALDLIKGELHLYRYEVTNALCLLGLKDEALRWMDYGYKNGFRTLWDYPYTYIFLERNPLLQPLRGDYRFQDLRKRAKADYDLWAKLCAGL